MFERDPQREENPDSGGNPEPKCQCTDVLAKNSEGELNLGSQPETHTDGSTQIVLGPSIRDAL